MKQEICRCDLCKKVVNDGGCLKFRTGVQSGELLQCDTDEATVHICVDCVTTIDRSNPWN